jgi:hypothetical protein
MATLTLIVVAMRCTDQRLSLIGTNVKQLGLAPAQAVQKPLGLSFQVPVVPALAAALVSAVLAPAVLAPAALALAALAPAVLAPAVLAPAALALPALPAGFAPAGLMFAALALTTLSAAGFCGSRRALPSDVKVILNLAPVGEAAMNGWPLKKVVLMSLGVIGSAATAAPGAKTKTKTKTKAKPKAKTAVRNSIMPPGESV